MSMSSSIAATMSGVQSTLLASKVGMAVYKQSLDTQKVMGEQMLQIIDKGAPPASNSPVKGQNVNIYA